VKKSHWPQSVTSSHATQSRRHTTDLRQGTGTGFVPCPTATSWSVVTFQQRGDRWAMPVLCTPVRERCGVMTAFVPNERGGCRKKCERRCTHSTTRQECERTRKRGTLCKMVLQKVELHYRVKRKFSSPHIASQLHPQPVWHCVQICQQ